MADRSEWIDKPKPTPGVDRGGVVLNVGKPVKLAQGALEGLWDLVGGSLDDDPKTQSLVDKIQTESARRQALVDDPETTFLGRAAKGAEDIVLGAAELGASLVPISNRRAGESPDAARERTQTQAQALGRTAAEGALVAPSTTFGALLPGSGVPLDTLSADPVGTALDLLPAAGLVGKAGKVAKKLPGATRVADAVEAGRAAAAATGPGRLLTAAGDTLKSWTSDNLAGTEVPDLPQIVRGAERLGKQAVKEIQEYIPQAGRYPEGHPLEGQVITQPGPFHTQVVTRKGDTRPTVTKEPAPLVDPADLPDPELAMQRPADPVSPLLPDTQKYLDDSARTFATGQDQIALLDKDIRRQVIDNYLPTDFSRQLARIRLEETLKELGSQPDVGTLLVGGGLVEDFKEAGRRSAGESPRAIAADGTEVPLAREMYPQRGLEEPMVRRQQLAGEMAEPVQRKVFDDVAAQEAMPWLAVAEDVPLPDLDLPRFIRAKDYDALEAGLKQRVIQAYPDGSGTAPKKIVSPEDQAKATKYLAAIQDYQPVTYRGVDLLAPKRVAVALKVEDAARSGLGPGLLQSLQQSMKSSLTSRSLKSGINNLMGNAILQSIRRAGHRGYRLAPRPTAYTPRAVLQTPPQALFGIAGGPVASELAYWARTGAERAWAKTARDSSDYTVQKWKALDKEAIYNTNQLDVELRDPGLVDYFSGKIPTGRNAVTAMAGRAAKATLGAGQKFTGLMESFYRSGDTWAKAAESSRVFDDLTRMLDRQPEGKTSVLRGRDGVQVEVTKLPGGAEFQVKSGRRSAILDDSSPEFFRLLAGVAAEQADRVFFDYGRTNRLAKKLRAMPIVGIGSPFYSWLSLATDLPGKKGLLSHAVTGPDFVLDRNWVTAADLADSLASNAARDALHGAMVHDIQKGKGEEYLDALAKYPNQYKMMLLADLTNPSYAEVTDLGNWNSFGPTQLAMAGLNAGQGLVRAGTIDPLDLERKGEGARLFKLLRKQQMKEGFTGEDAKELIGLGGSMILDSISKFDLSSRRGQPEAPLDHLFEIAARTLVGATTADLMTVGLGAVQEATGDPLLGNRAAFGKLSETIKRDKDPRIEEAFLKWAIRKFTGAGWQTIVTKPQEEKKRWSGIKTAWKSSLRIPAIKKDLDTMLARRDLAPDVRRKYAADRAQLARWERIVDEEVDGMRANYFKLKSQVQRRSPAPVKKVAPAAETDYSDDDED